MTDKPKPLRDERGRLLPGQPSLNAGGQPKAYAEVRKLLDSGVMAAAEMMLQLASSSTDEKVRMAAAKDILDRTLGKAKESVEVTSSANSMIALLLEALKKPPES